MSLSLYTINGLLRDAIDAAADRDTGEIAEDWADFLGAVEMERTQKALDIARWTKSLAAEAEAVAAEIRALTARKRGLEAKRDSVLRHLSRELHTGERVGDANTTIGWRRSASVEILDAAAIPEAYVRTERVPAKDEIKRALAAGESVPGAVMAEKINIQIK